MCKIISKMARKEDPLLGALWTMIWPFLTVFYCIAHIGLILLILLLFIGIFLIFLLYFKFKLLRKSRLQENDDHIIGESEILDYKMIKTKTIWCSNF